jgi:predicted dehydrogenase
MDYFKQSTAFKVKKVLRYVRLYGIERTRVKVHGQRHMKKQYETLPPRSKAAKEGQRVALIGCGNYAFSNIAHYLRKSYGDVIASCMDVDLHRAASLAEHHKVPLYTDDAQEIINNEAVELVYIASNHASHAEYAIAALEKGKSVYIEKPHVVNEDQLVRLVAAMEASAGRVFLGFNRPGSRFGRLILEHLEAEAGAGMYNWFVAGHEIDPDHWYFKPEEGGRVLGNLCHWTDFVLRMAGPAPFPIRINPTRAEKSDSDIAVTYTFRDGTIAVITFSAKGHTFEGVKEKLSAHRGNCLISMEDYETMTIDVVDVKKRFRNRYRDHGHKKNICLAYDAVFGKEPYDREATMHYVANSAWLFLKTKEALERNEQLEIEPFALPTPERSDAPRAAAHTSS